MRRADTLALIKAYYDAFNAGDAAGMRGGPAATAAVEAADTTHRVIREIPTL